MRRKSSAGLSYVHLAAVAVVFLVFGAVVGYLLVPGPVGEVVTTTVTRTSTVGAGTVTQTQTVVSTVTGAGGPAEFTIAMGGGAPSDPFWAPVIQGAHDAASAHNVNLKYFSTDPFDLNNFVDSLTAAVTGNPDGLCCGGWFGDAFDPQFKRAADKGIPILLYNGPDARPDEQKSYLSMYLGMVGQDEYENGLALGERVVRDFKEKGDTPTRVMVAIHAPGSVWAEDRSLGIKDRFDEAFPGTTVDKLDVTTDPTKIAELIRAYLTSHPDTDVVYTLGPVAATPMLKVLDEMGLLGEIRTATADLDTTIITAIKDGNMICGTAQQPYVQGYATVTLMWLYLKYGIIPPKHYATGPIVVDIDNVAVIEKEIETTGGA